MTRGRARIGVSDERGRESGKADGGTDGDAGGGATKSECSAALRVARAKAGEGWLANMAGPLCIRITRYGKRRYDGDNMQGGCKGLRDAIAAALGRPGDSAEDGLRWEYRQVCGAAVEVRTEVEFFVEG